MEISKKVTWKPLGEEVVAVKVETCEYYTMNEVASLIWKGIDSGMNQEQIADKILDEYDIEDRAAILQDIDEQISEWKTELLIN